MHIGNVTNGIRFDEESATYRAVHDWEEDGPIYRTVAAAVARAVGEGVTDVDPLAERIDPEALDGLFRPLREASDNRSTDDERRRRSDRPLGDEWRVAGGGPTAAGGMPTPTIHPSTGVGSVPADATREEYVQFVVADCRVTVTWDGLVVVAPPAER